MNLKSRKIISMALVFFMMLTILPLAPVTAHAAGTEITEAELFEQIELTNAMINGSSIVNSNGSAFTKTNGTGWELKYSQSGTWLYFDLYLDNANINQVNFTGKLLKDSAYSVQFNVHVKGNCSISGLYVEISHTDPKYQFGGEMASYSNLDANILYDSHNSTLDASNFIQIKGLYNVRLRVDNNGYTGDTLKCNYFDVGGTNWLTRIDMNGVNFIAKPASGSTGVVFNVYNCGIYLTNCNVLFNLPESMRPFQDGNNKISFSNEMVEYGGKVERIHVGVPGAEADYVDSNRYAAILSSENLAKYLKFTNQNPAMPSGNTETDITAILGKTETYQFNNAALPSWLAEGGFDVYRSWEHSKDGSTIVGNGNSADDLMTYSYNYTNAGTYKFVEELTLKYFNETVSGAKKTNTFNITTKQAPKFTTQPTSGEVNVGEKHTVTWATDFTPVKQYIKVYNSDDTDNSSVPIDADVNSYSLSSSDGYYRIRAYYGDGATDYVDSEKIYVTVGEGSGEGGETTEIAELNATVEEPAIGGTPATTATTTGAGYTVEITTWFENDSFFTGTEFAADKEYAVVVKFTPASGKTIADSAVATINGKEAVRVGQDSSTGAPIYKVVFDKLTEEGGETTEIAELNATVEEPAIGGTPATTATTTGAGYTVEITTWFENDSFFTGTEFAADKEYAVVVKFTPASGKTIADSAVATINGKEAVRVGQDSSTGAPIYKVVFDKLTEEGGETPEPTEYNITVTGGTASANKAVAGTVITLTVDESKIPAGKVFDKWEVVSGGVTITDNKFTMPANAVEVKATYKDQTFTVNYLVTLEYNNGSESAKFLVASGATVTKPADPTREGYIFKGWFLGETEYDFATKVTGPITLTAKWEEHTHAWGGVTYTWAEDGSSCTAERVCTEDSTHKETATATITSAVKTPATETEKGTTTYTATFAEGWAVTQTKDIQDIPVLEHEHTYSTEWSKDATYHWHAATCGHDVVDAKAAHVYDNSKDATCNVCNYTRTISSGSSSGGGFSGSYNYPVIVGDTDGADVAVSDEHATKGEEITITVTPDAGKQVDEVIVTDADGDEIAVTKTGDNEYTFTMPASKVTVDVATEAADYGLRIVMQINNKNILVNGKTMVNDVAPVIVGDRTLVPIRVVTELLGGSAHWDNATRTVTLKIDGKTMNMTIGKEIPGFGTSAVIMNDRTYVPVRYVMEKLGADVEWINATRQIIIEK